MLQLSFSFRLKDLGQIKEVKKITTPTATGTSLRTAVSPCVGPSLPGKNRDTSCTSLDLREADASAAWAQASPRRDPASAGGFGRTAQRTARSALHLVPRRHGLSEIEVVEVWPSVVLCRAPFCTS